MALPYSIVDESGRFRCPCKRYKFLFYVWLSRHAVRSLLQRPQLLEVPIGGCSWPFMTIPHRRALFSGKLSLGLQYLKSR